MIKYVLGKLTKSCKETTCLTHDTATTAQRGHRISHLVSLQTMITRQLPPCLSSPLLTSMLYLSLASVLASMMGMQGMIQPRSVYKRPDLPRFSAVL